VFVVFFIRNFKKLIRESDRHSIHGVILLSTVATQSVVISWVELIPSLSSLFFIIGIGVGICFYVCGVILIFLRYLPTKEWSLSEDWANTNCIIHGALSITGLALVLSHSATPSVLVVYWIVVLCSLVLIETIEIARAFTRVKKHGWREGIFIYNISQWSRNFTFGMFYAFSITIVRDPFYASVILPFHKFILNWWPWIVFILLICELYLWVDSKLALRKNRVDIT
jgi:hypothetical protein